MCCTTAHAAATGAPDLVDWVVELSIVYPGQSACAKYCARRSPGVRCNRIEAPFGVYAYLCRSTETLVTPGTAKSNGATSTPSARRYGSTQPPMHASTWNRMPRAPATEASSGIGSTT